MNTKTKMPAEGGLSRRDFLKTSATAGLGLALAGKALGEAPQAKPAAAKNPDELRVAVIGCGAQGRVLTESILRIPAIRIAAICDIWSYSQTYTANYLKKYGHIVRVYEDYRDLLAKEKDLQAAIVATPDWMHAEHANACLRAGLHVYCEKEMSNSLEKARSMVLDGPRNREAPPDRPPAPLQPSLHPRHRPPHPREKPPRPGHRGLRPVEPSQERPPRLAGEIRDRPGHAREVRLQLHDRVPELAPLQEIRRRAHGRPRLAPDRPLRLGLRRRTRGRSWPAAASTIYKNWEWYDNVMAIYEFDTPAGHGPGPLPGPDDDPARRFLRDLHGRERVARPLRDPDKGELGPAGAGTPRNGIRWPRPGFSSRRPRPSRRAPRRTSSSTSGSPPRRAAGRCPWSWPSRPTSPISRTSLTPSGRGTPLSCPAELAYESCVAVLKANETVKARRITEFRPEQFKA